MSARKDGYEPCSDNNGLRNLLRPRIITLNLPLFTCFFVSILLSLMVQV